MTTKDEGGMAHAAAEKPRVVVVSDHPLTRYGLKLLLDQHGQLECVAEMDFGAASTAAIIESRIDLVVVDVAHPLRKALGWVRRLRSEHGNARVLAVAALPEWLLAVRALRAGAAGFVSKGASTEEIVQAAHLTTQGHGYVGQGALSQLVGSPHSPSGDCQLALLSDCELDVFYYLVDGVSISQIKGRLNMTEKAVRNYKARVSRKLGLSSLASFTQYAVDRGLIAAAS